MTLNLQDAYLKTSSQVELRLVDRTNNDLPVKPSEGGHSATSPCGGRSTSGGEGRGAGVDRY